MIPVLTDELPKPFTIIPEGNIVTFGETVEMVRASHREHGPVLQAYADTWYRSGHTWAMVHFLGHSVMKSPNDLWMYQDLFWRLRPQTVIETGTYTGGSALWFSCLMDWYGLPESSKVYTIDIEEKAKRVTAWHPRIEFLEKTSSLDPRVRDRVAPKIVYPLLLVLDADHTEAFVRQEMDVWSPLVRPGDYMIVEDTNVDWPGVDGGARMGVSSFLDDHPGAWEQDLCCERFLHTCHPGGWLKRIA